MVKRLRDSPSPPSDNAPSVSTIDSGPSSPTSDHSPSRSSKFTHFEAEVHPKEVMRCSLPPHHETLAFSSFEDYDVHYAKSHANRCSECRKNFPTDHFLSLHIEENHDPLNAAKRDRGEKTYRCFVEDCDKVCSAPQKRRMHLVDKHMFPKNYDFLVVDDGIDKRSSMLRTRHRRRSSAASRALHRDQQMRSMSSVSTSNILPVSKENQKGLGTATRAESPDVGSSQIRDQGRESPPLPVPHDEIDNLTATMSALRFVPPSIRFGRGGRRGGLSRT